MLGNALAEQFPSRSRGDWPLGAAYCVVTLCIVAVGLVIHTSFTRNSRERNPMGV